LPKAYYDTAFLTEYANNLVGSTEIRMTCLPDYGFIVDYQLKYLRATQEDRQNEYSKF
jgi:hypothetical protein